ncbi:MAG: DUF4129 domain-containing protein [Armatimonadetes bacterium]|jgi:hypothetical protein|nr:DUF4129 domain-containing protein [Armatimonadota bacterium]
MKRFALPIIAIVMLFALISAEADQISRVDTAQVERELKQILSSPEYQAAPQNPIDKWAQKIGKAVVGFLKRVGERLALHLSFDTKSKTLDLLGAWIVAAGFVALLFWVIRRLFMGSRIAEKDDSSADVFSHKLPAAEKLIRQAAVFAQSGDYRNAFRSAYTASLAYLDDIRALKYERSRTNWEYLRSLRQSGREGLYAQLRPITSDFDRKIYGGEACQREDYIHAMQVYDNLSREGAG